MDFKLIEKEFNIKLREPQKIAISALTSGENIIVQLQTGGGKTMLYVAYAYLCKQIVLVVTPTIALRNDQVKELDKVNLISVYQLSQAGGQNEIKLYDLENKDLGASIILITPEKLEQASTQKVLKRLAEQGKIGCITVDECHYIYEWKQFRNAYQKLLDITSNIIRIQSDDNINPVLMLLSATISPECYDYLMSEYLKRGIKLKCYQFDIYRNNLNFINMPLEAKFENLIRILVDSLEYTDDLDYHTLIYCTTKEKNQQLAQKLTESGIKTYLYYSDYKNNDQEVKKFTENKKSCMCCTVSFGMGINITSVNQVINYNIPSTISESLQKLGRAGRKGQQSLCIQFYDMKNIDYYLKILIVNQNFDKIYEYILLVQTIQRQICVQAQFQSYYNGFNVHPCGQCDICKQIKGQKQLSQYRYHFNIDYYLLNVSEIIQKILSFLDKKQLSILQIKELQQYLYDQLEDYGEIFNQLYLLKFIIFELIIRKDIILNNEYMKTNTKPPCKQLSHILIPIIYFE